MSPRFFFLSFVALTSLVALLIAHQSFSSLLQQRDCNLNPVGIDMNTGIFSRLVINALDHSGRVRLVQKQQ